MSADPPAGDRLAAIRQRRQYMAPHRSILEEDVDWLVGQAEESRREINKLRAEISLLADRNREFFGIGDELDEAKEQVERLRGLLRQLEWIWDVEHQDGRCPVCYALRVVANPDGTVRDGSHDPGCWLAREIGVETAEASPTPEGD